MTQKFLGNAYHPEGTDAIRGLYRGWAASYEDEVTENGYVSPVRTAEALVKCN